MGSDFAFTLYCRSTDELFSKVDVCAGGIVLN